MPPQTPSDQSYPEQARWNEPSQQPRRNGNPDQRRWNGAQEQQRWSEPSQSHWDRAPEQPRWSPSGNEAQARSYDDRASYAAPQPAAGRKPPMSRRSMLRGAAGVGVVGAVAAAGAGAVVAINNQDDKPSLMPVSKPVAMVAMAPSAMAGPLVVYIADTTNGLLDVYGGTGQTRIHNPALVKQLLDNLKLA